MSTSESLSVLRSLGNPKPSVSNSATPLRWPTARDLRARNPMSQRAHPHAAQRERPGRVAGAFAPDCCSHRPKATRREVWSPARSRRGCARGVSATTARADEACHDQERHCAGCNNIAATNATGLFTFELT